MKKRFFAWISILTIGLSLASCALWKSNSSGEQNDLKNELYGIVEYVDGDFIRYQDEDYYLDPLGFFIMEKDGQGEESILLSWQGLWRDFGYVNRYYSETAENPIYIFEKRVCAIYFRSDYDYRTDTFFIEGTDRKIVFSEVIPDTEYIYGMHKSHVQDIVLRSEQYPSLYTPLEVFLHNGSWYVCNHHGWAFAISDQFVDLLSELGIIDTE